MNHRNRTTKLLIAVASLSLVAAACGSDDNDSASIDAPAATGAMDEGTTPTTDAMDEEMTPTTDAMDEEMTATTDAMDEDNGRDRAVGSALLGGSCRRRGSFAGMTDDTAATAASNNPVLSTLVQAVSAAGLVDTLNSDGPFTIFAPANPAFEALPPGTLDAVLADQDLLTSILTLHVVAGEKSVERRSGRTRLGDDGQRGRHHPGRGGRRLTDGQRAGDCRLCGHPDGKRHGPCDRCGADALIGGACQRGGVASAAPPRFRVPDRDPIA